MELFTQKQLQFARFYGESLGASPELAATMAQTTMSEVRLWMQHEQFQTLLRETVAIEQGKRRAMAEMKLGHLIARGDFPAIKFALEAYAPITYDSQIRRQTLANEGLKQAVMSLPQPVFITQTVQQVDKDYDDLPDFGH